MRKVSKEDWSDINLYSLPPEERNKIINDYNKFKKNQAKSPVYDFVRNAVDEFQALLHSTNYDFAVKSTSKYLKIFQQLIDDDLVSQTNDLIADYLLNITDSGKATNYGVEFLMYTETYQEDNIVSLMLAKVNHTITADVTIKFRDGITINKKEVIPIGVYAVLIRKNIHTGRLNKKVYYLL